MKKVLVFFVLGFFGVFAVFAQANSKRYVCVENLKLKSGTGIFSSTIQTLNYGDEVTLVEENGKNAKIKTGAGNTGWVSTSSLTKKKIIKNSNVSASTDEIALAGKGFSAEVESEYKKSGKYDYASVDVLEQKTISEAELKAFIERRSLNIK